MLTKILYLITKGETFSDEEATQLFFSATKLFQSPHVHLRRILYIVIKELRIASDSSLIVVSCLQKDMTSTVDPFRANSIRVLAKVMDPSMVTNIERFLRQSLVDKNPLIVSSTLVAAQHLYAQNTEVVKRWITQIQEAMNSPASMVQYHALALMYKIKQNDRLAITKAVASLVKTAPKASMVTCLLIRIVGSDIATSAQPNAELIKFLTSCLHFKTPMVTYEAAACMCNLQCLTPMQLTPAILALQELLGSSAPTQRFAAVRTLAQVVTRHPFIVSPCSPDLERLLGDSNRSIGTLAITTLLKTGSEANVDRLMKSISGFMSEISDEFRIVMISAVKTLAIKFPAKHQTLMNFLSSSLREEGGFKFKKAIVDAILEIIQASNDAVEMGLEHFCEFIEDCEFPELSAKIIHILCDRGPSTANPARYIRFIFNRVILEAASVRAAAVTALGKFAVSCPQLTESVVVLLSRCLNDNDDEVRDRCAFYLNMLEQQDSATTETLFTETMPPLADLEYSLQQYLDTGDKSKAFDISTDLTHAKQEEDKSASERKIGEPVAEVAKPKVVAPTRQTGQLEALAGIPEIAKLGPVYKSSAPVDITEAEAEYIVSCTKHTFAGHVVFQFSCVNNMANQQLEDVTVEMSLDAGWEEKFSIPESKLAYNVAGSVFVCVAHPEGVYNSGPISNVLRFKYRDVDNGEVSGSAVEDEYELEELEVFEADFMRPDLSLGLVEFKRQWESLGNANEVVKKFNLGATTLQAAVDRVIENLGMGACEGSNVVADDARSHAVNLAGRFLHSPPVQILARAGVMMADGKGVNLKIAVRSENQELNQLVCNGIR